MDPGPFYSYTTYNLNHPSFSFYGGLAASLLLLGARKFCICVQTLIIDCVTKLMLVDKPWGHLSNIIADYKPLHLGLNTFLVKRKQYTIYTWVVTIWTLTFMFDLAYKENMHIYNTISIQLDSS